MDQWINKWIYDQYGVNRSIQMDQWINGSIDQYGGRLGCTNGSIDEHKLMDILYSISYLMFSLKQLIKTGSISSKLSHKRYQLS